jgi:hypothetical protein
MKSKIYTKLSMVFAAMLMFSYAATSQTTITVALTDGLYDAEERATDIGGDAVGSVDLGSSDLELVFDHEIQYVGLIFQNVEIPVGATITNAYVQFTVDALVPGTTDQTLPSPLVVYGAAEANVPGPFTEDPFTVSSHPSTTAKVTGWQPPPSVAVGDAGEAERTPDISAVIQEIINLAGWASGNNIMIVVTADPITQTEDINREMEAAPPDGDGGTSLVVTFTAGTAVNPVLDEFSSLYPNPAEGKINIDNPSRGKFSFEIYSINGKLVARRDNITGPTTVVDLSSFAKGVYFVDVKSAEKTETHKLVVK